MSEFFTINGFYMAMREKFTKPDANLKYFVVEFNENDLSWSDFRCKILGSTDPVDAIEGSLRNTIYNKYESLGLSSKPNVGDNGVHASASPFEGLCERLNWLNASLDNDTFGKILLDNGLSKDTIMEWTKDPQWEFNGKKGSLFDAFEDMNVSDNISKACNIDKNDIKNNNNMNIAFVFIKPHACNDKVNELVVNKFNDSKIKIIKEGNLNGKDIDDNKYIDNHY